MKILKKLGIFLVNFSVNKLGVKPYDTSLFSLPKSDEFIVHPTIYPIKLIVNTHADERTGIPHDAILNEVCKRLALSNEFKQCVSLREQRVSRYGIAYEASVFVLPKNNEQ